MISKIKKTIAMFLIIVLTSLTIYSPEILSPMDGNSKYFVLFFAVVGSIIFCFLFSKRFYEIKNSKLDGYIYSILISILIIIGILVAHIQRYSKLGNDLVSINKLEFQSIILIILSYLIGFVVLIVYDIILSKGFKNFKQAVIYFSFYFVNLIFTIIIFFILSITVYPVFV